MRPPQSLPISSTASRLGSTGDRLLIVDEGWLALDDEGFAGQLRECTSRCARRMRRLSLPRSRSPTLMAPPSPDHHRELSGRLFLPNERAMKPQITAIYRRFRCNDRRIRVFPRRRRSATTTVSPAAAIACSSSDSARVALALTAASSKSDQALIERTLAEHAREARRLACRPRRSLGRRPHPRPQHRGIVAVLSVVSVC